MQRVIFFLILGISLGSCERVLDSIFSPRCEIVEESALRIVSSGDVAMDVVVKNRGSARAYNVEVRGQLSIEGRDLSWFVIGVSDLGVGKEAEVTLLFKCKTQGLDLDRLSVDLSVDYEDDSFLDE